jgi:hypothetical protein
MKTNYLLKSVDTHDSTKLHFDHHRHRHAMLLYRHSDEQDSATIYVNEALSRGYLTIYLPITTSLSKSINYYKGKEEEDVVNQGNLLTFDTRTFYNFALAGDMQPFEELKVLVEEAIEEKRRVASKIKDKDEEEMIVIVAEVAAELARNGKLEECIKVEEWWQKTHSEWLQKGLKVTIICPHSDTVFLDNSEFVHDKQAISCLHHAVVDVESEFE